MSNDDRTTRIDDDSARTTALTESEISGLYADLEVKRLPGVISRLADDITFHIVRSTPEQVLKTKSSVVAYLAEAARLEPTDADIRLEQHASGGEFSFSVHVEAEGTPREHRHVMVWRVNGGEVTEVWELPFGGHQPSHTMDSVIHSHASQAT